MLDVFSFIVALFVSTALIPPLTYASKYLGLVDVPNQRKIHARAVPRIGGIGIILGVLVPILMWIPWREDIKAYLIGVVILAVFGIWDDRTNLNYRVKFLGQFCAVLVVVLYGGVVIDRFPFVESGVLPDYIAVPFTVVLLVGVTNAINLADGLDGLAGGTTLLAVGCLAALAYMAEDGPIVLTSLAVIGATLGFLRFNTYPARIFMGDTGSQFLGFTTGVLAVIVTNISNRALSPVVPILILGLPILDTLSVMAQRLSEGRSPFSPDRNHIHHKLLDLGFSHYEAVVSIYAVQAIMVSLAFMLRYSWDELILSLYAAFCVVVIVFFRLARIYQWRLRAGNEPPGLIGKGVDFVRQTGFLSKGPYVFLQVAVPAFLLMGAIFPKSVSIDFAVFSILLLAGLLTALLVRSIPFNLIERFVAYVTASFIAFLIETTFQPAAYCETCLHAFFALLAVVIAIWVRFTGNRKFRVSGLDFLIVFIAIVVPNLEGFLQPNNVVAAVALESIILFYAIEVLLSQEERHWDMLRFSTLGTLAVLGIRGFF